MKDVEHYHKIWCILRMKMSFYTYKIHTYSDRMCSSCFVFVIALSRHVSNTDRVGKRYRNMANVFSIGDDDDGKIFALLLLKYQKRIWLNNRTNLKLSPWSMAVSLCFVGDDQGENSSDDDRKEVVNVEVWLKKPDIKYSCRCQEVIGNGYMFPRSGIQAHYVIIYS